MEIAQPWKEQRDFLCRPEKCFLPPQLLPKGWRAPARSSAGGASTGEGPKIGHRRMHIREFAALKYLCPGNTCGKAGFWVGLFFLLRM